MDFRPALHLTFIGVLSALTACDQGAPAANSDPNAPSPTSSVCNDASGPPSPEQIRTLARMVERGDPKACSDQSVLNYLMGEAVAANKFLTVYGWTAASRADFYATYTSDVKGIVLNAHDPVAKSVSCGATYYEISSRQQFWQEIKYELQVTVDGEVVTRIDDRAALQSASMLALEHYARTVVYPRYQQQNRERLAETSVAADRPAVNSPSPMKDTSRAPSPMVESSAEREIFDRIEVAGPPVITRQPPEPPSNPAHARQQIISNPTWVRAPQARMPELALSRGFQSGSVTLSCAVQRNGSLASCNIVSEMPSRAGLGQAAAQAAASARVAPQTVDELTVGGSVRFTVRFSAD